MRKVAYLHLFIMIAILLAADLGYAQCGAPCLFYGGDFDPNNPNANGLSNENDAIVGGNPYGAATYQNFIVGGGGWGVGALFSNDLENGAYFVPATANAKGPTAYWEIRSGVSEGIGGTLIASGTGADTVTPTGRSGFGYTEYRNEVDGLNINLNAGTYWFALVPNAANRGQVRSFNSNTFGLNSVGVQLSNDQFFNSSFFGANFTNANNQGTFPTFSSGVLAQWIPEPSSFVLLGSGLAAVAGVVRRHVFEVSRRK